MSSSDSDSSSDIEGILDLVELLPRPRIFRERSNPLQEYDNVDFKARFRFSKQTFMDILHLVGQQIEKLTARSMAVSAQNQLLITLRYYATGAFQNVIADNVHVHKSTVSRIIRQVSHSIAQMSVQYINMPQGNSLQTVKQGFYNICNFPNVIGAIDCSHMKIGSPGRNLSELFRNRKGYFSINVQAVCDTNLRILDIVARWPGSVHDSTIFDASFLRARFENNEYPNCFLLGDSAYPCRSYMLTPLLHPNSEAEENYQRSQIATRNPVERLFSVWKRRFPVLALGMRTKLHTTLSTIVATAVLHNIANEHNEPLPEGSHGIEVVEIPVEPVGSTESRHFHNENATRTALINTVFSKN